MFLGFLNKGREKKKRKTMRERGRVEEEEEEKGVAGEEEGGREGGRGRELGLGLVFFFLQNIICEILNLPS